MSEFQMGLAGSKRLETPELKTCLLKEILRCFVSGAKVYTYKRHVQTITQYNHKRYARTFPHIKLTTNEHSADREDFLSICVGTDIAKAHTG